MPFHHGLKFIAFTKSDEEPVSPKYTGNAGVVVDSKIIFSIALKACASTIILAHNHPSGSLKPNNQDLCVTKKLVEGGKILDIQVADHLIISKYGYYSFTDNDLM